MHPPAKFLDRLCGLLLQSELKQRQDHICPLRHVELCLKMGDIFTFNYFQILQLLVATNLHERARDTHLKKEWVGQSCDE